MATADTRHRPNILIVGTPCTGKTTIGEQIAQKLNFEHIEVGKEIREHQLHSGFDEARNCHIVDDDKLLDHLEDRMDSDDGGYIIDYHGCDLFPERWFDLVVVLRCDNTILYDRLAERGYSDEKVRENVECEIFGVLAEEACDSYSSSIVHELKNDTVDQMRHNIDQIVDEVHRWIEKKKEKQDQTK